MNLVKRLKRLFLGVPGMLLATIQNHAVLAGESEFKSLIFDKNLINICNLVGEREELYVEDVVSALAGSVCLPMLCVFNSIFKNLFVRLHFLF